MTFSPAKTSASNRNFLVVANTRQAQRDYSPNERKERK